MAHLFIEACNAKPAWHALDQQQRDEYLGRVGMLMAQLVAHNVDIVAWGYNDETTPARAPYDFFAVFRFPSADLANEYEHAFRDAGWYDYFEQINIGGTAEPFPDVLARLSAL